MIGEASAPASSGNLGPGFDTLALALSLRCIATAEPSDSMTITENGSTNPLEIGDIIHRVVDMAVGRPMHITLSNEIPRAKGLGSSGAVMSSVAAAAMKATADGGGRRKVFEIVTELEGHADNPAASVFGGLIVASLNGVKRMRLHDSLHPVVGIPDSRLKTVDARKALPESVSFDAVTRTITRLSFLLAGLVDGDVDALSHAGGDEIHELPRAELSPITGELIDAARRAGAVHACWSGAGPSALAFTTSATRGRVIGAMGGVLGVAGEVLALKPDYEGLI
ncbi:MAG: homoserine kinase [Acidimicrobiia bacterium]|nr:MAG: homoserine kinase [Acidimicrobiia bacterium]